MPHLDVDEMTGPEFEFFVGGVLRYHGYLVGFTSATGDFGVDLVLRRGAEIVAVQCKRWTKPIGAAAIQQVVAGAVMYGCTSTMVVTNQSFTPGAVALAARNDCALIDGSELSRLARDWQPDDDEVRIAEERALAVNAAKLRDWKRREEMAMFERFSRNARISVVLAQEEARELESDEIRPEHLLVGVLQSAGRELSRVLAGHGLTAEQVRERLATEDSPRDESFDEEADALRSIGIDLHAVRENVDRTFGAGTYDNALRKSGRRRRRRGHIPFTKPAKKVLELSLREALAHKDNTIGCEHILLGILRGGDKFTVGLIAERVEVPQLRDAIVGLLDEAA
jgi:ATP-dependent Clp protease ATP-binding subunit ClpA